MIKVLNSARIKSKNSILLMGGDDNATEIGCFAFLIKSGGEYILIDTGIEDIDVVNKTKSSKDDWKRSGDDAGVSESLERLGISCKDISRVLLTHSHYDHISGITHFPQAKIYMSAKEYEFLKTDNPHKPFLGEQIAFLEKNKPVLLNGDTDISEDIKAVCVGAHTPGSVMYIIKDSIFTGDNVYLLEAVEKNIPIGFGYDLEEAKRAVGIAKDFKGKVYTSHDLKCPDIRR